MTIPITTNTCDISIRSPTDGVPNSDYHPLPGRVGNLTEVQLYTVNKLKEDLKENGHFVEERMNDAMLLR